MGNPTCANCRRQSYAASPLFCPFCNRPFVALNEAPTSAMPQTVTPVRQPVRLTGRTTPSRAIGVTTGVGVLMALIVLLLWWQLTRPNPQLDAWFFHIIYTSHAFSPLPTQPILFLRYAFTMFLLLSCVPPVIASAYWYALRRLYQEFAPRIWLQTWGLAVAIFGVLFLLLGGEISLLNHVVVTPAVDHQPFWALEMMTYFPALLVVIVLVAGGCAGLGLLGARYFARWPLERVQQLRSRPLNDALLTGGASILAVFVQFLCFEVLDGAGDRFSADYWWFPLGSALVVAVACWLALRPLATRPSGAPMGTSREPR